MKDFETKQRIVELRAHGKSQRAVAEELGIGLQTVVRCERALTEQIENHKVMEFEALFERHRLTRQAQIERYGIELARVSEEIQKRDLSDVETPKLYDIMIKLDARVDQSRPALTLHDDEEIEDLKALRELIASRRARKASGVNAPDGRQGNGDGTVRAEDLVTLQLSTLHRFRAGKIDGRAAANEMAIVNSILKGINIADLQTRLERLEIVLGAGEV